MATMVFNVVLVVFALASVSLPSAASSSLASVSNPPPRISIQALRSALSSESSGINLHRLLHDSRGILRIAVGGHGSGKGRDFSDLRKSALSHMCDCPTFRPSSMLASSLPSDGGFVTFEEALKSHPKDLQKIILPDGTERRTLATAAVGFESEHASALELPSWVQNTCGRDAYESFEELRDVVADVVESFVERLDQENKSRTKGWLNANGVAGGSNDQSYHQILTGANHLEHFHVYTKSTGPSVGDDEEINSLGNTPGRGNQVEETPSTLDYRNIFGNTPGRGNQVEETPSTLDYHTDAGFFLSFVPAMSCHSYTTDDSSFYLEGQEEPITFEDDEVVIMMGAGAQYWLPSREHGKGDKEDRYRFLAASHALRLSHGTHRTWYGKMYLLPSWLTPRNVSPLSTASVKYGDVLPSFELKGYEAHVPTSPVDGCGTTAFNEDTLPTLLSPGTQVEKHSRRRLAHANSPAECNNQTNFFCWKQCRPIPEAEHAEEYVQNGYSLYCLDPGMLSSSENSINDATDPCQGGYIMNSKCTGSWQETDYDVPGYKLPYEVKKKEQVVNEKLEERDQSSVAQHVPEMEDSYYCHDGTSMYMDGFHWQGTTCVIYLFQSWVLSTRAKFALAAMGSILFGIALEFVLWKRRGIYASAPGVRRLCLSASIYVLQLTMGYFIMLVIMTYSAPLFVSCVGGMMIGHVFFNAQDSLAKRWSAEKNKVVPEAEMEKTVSPSEPSSYESGRSYGSYRNGNEGAELEKGGRVIDGLRLPFDDELPTTEKTKLMQNVIPDGVTPCCQYTVSP